MFGFTEQELERYKDLVQTYAIRDLAADIVHGAGLIVELVEKDGKYYPVTSSFKTLVTDIEIVLTVNALHMAYDYAHLQDDIEKTEEDIIKYLHDKYETKVINQFIRYGIVTSANVAETVVMEVILELPYLYSLAFKDKESFDGDAFIEERLYAYDEYIENMGAEEEDDDDDDEDEEDEE